MNAMQTQEVTIRLAHDGDGRALGRLAQLDGTLHDGGPSLVAEVGGRLVAALPLEGSPGFADPFRRTAQVVDMLELRRRQLHASQEMPSPVLSRALRAVRRRRRYRAPASA